MWVFKAGRGRCGYGSAFMYLWHTRTLAEDFGGFWHNGKIAAYAENRTIHIEIHAEFQLYSFM
jgi:hypothetical protein